MPFSPLPPEILQYGHSNCSPTKQQLGPWPAEHLTEYLGQYCGYHLETAVKFELTLPFFKKKREFSTGKLKVLLIVHLPPITYLSCTNFIKLVLRYRFPLDRRSAVIDFERGYPTMPLEGQLVH